MKMRQIDNYYANLARQNKIRSDLIKANAQKQMDDTNRNYIIEYQGQLGYNPYQMQVLNCNFSKKEYTRKFPKSNKKN